MSKKTDLKEGARAAQDLEDIRTLQKIPAWKRYWERSVVAPAQRLREKILTDQKLTKDELWELRIRLEERMKTLQTIIQDEAACRSIIEQMPQEPEESEDAATAGE